MTKGEEASHPGEKQSVQHEYQKNLSGTVAR